MKTSSKRDRLALVAGLLILMVLICGLVWEKSPDRPIQMTFLNFTNSPTGPEAVFLVQFPPKFGGCGWGSPLVSFKEGAAWKNWSLTNSARPSMDMFQFGGRTFATFPIRATNELSRIVVQVDESPPLSLFNLIRVKLNLPVSIPPPRTYFLTNETVDVPAK